jgi:hypothetical protein
MILTKQTLDFMKKNIVFVNSHNNNKKDKTSVDVLSFLLLLRKIKNPRLANL